MFYRIVLTFLLLISSAFAADFQEILPAGKMEKMSYEIKTFKPQETVNFNDVKIASNRDGTITINQTLEIPNQSVTIYSTEHYDGKSLRLMNSENSFKFPRQVSEKLKTDSLVIKAEITGDSMDITANADIIQVGKIPFRDDCITSTGSQLMARSMNFKIGQSKHYSFINLLMLSNKQFSQVSVVDSVIGREEVTTSLGTYDCYKVVNLVPGTKGYTFYTAGERHLPIKIELVDPANDEILMTLILKKYERVDI